MGVAAWCYIGVMWFVLLMLFWEGSFVKKPNGAYLAGITIPAEHRGEACVREVLRAYEKRLYAYLLCMGAAALFTLCLKDYLSLQLFFLGAWLTVCIILEFLLTRKAVRDMYALKKEKGWAKPAGAPDVTLVDTRASRLKHTMPVSMWTMLPSLWLSVSLMLWWLFYATDNKGSGVFALLGLLTTLLGFYLFRMACHAKLRVYSEDTEINLCINKVRKRCLTGLVAWEIFLQAAFTGVTALSLYYGKVGVLRFFLPAVALVALLAAVPVFAAASHVRKIREELLLAAPLVQDEDEYWLNGFYCNPNDPSVFVEPRIGFGVSVNMAKPSMRYLTYGSLLFALAACIGGGIWCLSLDFAKITLKEQPEAFVVSGGGFSETVPYDEICGAELVYKLPPVFRTFGSATENWLFGEYRLSGTGTADVFVKRDQDLFLLIKRSSGRYLLLALETEEETRSFYERLTKRQPAP